MFTAGEPQPARSRAASAALGLILVILAMAALPPAPALAAPVAPSPATPTYPAEESPGEEQPAEPAPTDEPKPTAQPDQTVPPTAPPAQPTVTVTSAPEATDEGVAAPGPQPPQIGVLEPEAPAITEARTNLLSWGIAAIVLIGAVTLVLVFARRTDTTALRPLLPVDDAAAPTDAAAKLAAMEATGEAMLDAGYSVTGVHSVLRDMARVNGFPDTEVVVFPTALFVSARGLGEVRTGAVSSGHSRLTLAQIDALDDIVKDARSEPTDPGTVVAAVAAVRTQPPTFSPLQRTLAYGMVSGALAVLLGGSWAGVGLAGVLGLGIGVVMMLTENAPRWYEALITVGSAFAVSVIVFGLSQYGLDPGVLAALIAPLVTFLPGGLLTTGIIELSTGQMMAGAGRLAAGVMQLVLLATGVVAGAALVGVPRLEFGEAMNPLGPLGPWLAVAIFGVGIVIYRSGRRDSIAWILLVLYVAYGAQVLGDIFFGGVLSALIGAAAMTPVAYLVSTQRNGPAAFASFLPAFWMMVPGALGLVGVAAILDGDSAGLNTLATTASTMVAITLGILAGSVLGNRLAGRGTVVAV